MKQLNSWLPLIVNIAAALLVLLLDCGKLAVVEAANQCLCKKVDDSFIVTRLWDIVGEGTTDQDVIDEFNRGFAPIVTNMGGFQEYTSAATGNESTVFFFNIFETEREASLAQFGAKKFVDEGALNGLISPNKFTQDHMRFHIASEDCVEDSIDGKYLSTRLWRLSENSNFTTEGVSDTFEQGYGPIVSGEPDFLEYGGAVVYATDLIFFYNVFETQEGARAANEGAAKFVEDSNLRGNIEKVVFTEGLVGFDYSCAGEVPAPISASTSANAGLTAIIAAAIVVSIMLVKH